MYHVLLLIFWYNALFSFLPGFHLPFPFFSLPCNTSHSFTKTHTKQITNQVPILPYFPPCSQNHIQRFGGVLSWGEVKSLSRVWLFATPWTVAYQAPPVHGIFQARILEWVAISFSRASFLPRYQTWVPRIVGRRFTVWATREARYWYWDWQKRGANTEGKSFSSCCNTPSPCSRDYILPEEPGGLQSMGSQRVGHNGAHTHGCSF